MFRYNTISPTPWKNRIAVSETGRWGGTGGGVGGQKRCGFRGRCRAWGGYHSSVQSSRRGVAQPGRAPGSGPGGRWFESTRPDQIPGRTRPSHLTVHLGPHSDPGVALRCSLPPCFDQLAVRRLNDLLGPYREVWWFAITSSTNATGPIVNEHRLNANLAVR